MTENGGTLARVQMSRLVDEPGRSEFADNRNWIRGMVFTSERRDRYGDVIRMRGAQLEDYKRNPVILLSHGMTSAPITAIGVGSNITATKSVTKKPALSMDIRFARTPLAQEVALLWEDKILRANSLGFQPDGLASMRVIGPDEKPVSADPNEFLGRAMPEGYGWEFLKWHLLENSICPVPANPDAVGRSFEPMEIDGEALTRMRSCVEVSRAFGLSHKRSFTVPAFGRATFHKAACQGGHCPGCAGEVEPVAKKDVAADASLETIERAAACDGAPAKGDHCKSCSAGGDEKPAFPGAAPPFGGKAAKECAGAGAKGDHCDGCTAAEQKAAKPEAPKHKGVCPGGHCPGCSGTVGQDDEAAEGEEPTVGPIAKVADEVDMAKVSRILAETSVEECPACRTPQPYNQWRRVFVGHEKFGGGLCASAGLSIESPVGITFVRFMRLLGTAGFHDVQAAREALLATGAISLSFVDAACQATTRAEAVARTASGFLAKEGKVLSRKNQAIVEEAMAAAQAMIKSLQALLDAAAPPEQKEAEVAVQSTIEVSDDEVLAAAVQAVARALASQLEENDK